MHLTPGLHGAEPDSVAPPEDMPPRPQNGYSTGPEGTWYGGRFGDVPLESEFDPCGRPHPPVAMPESDGEDE